MPDGKALASAYSRAGTDFLANRLEGMFRVIKTQEDIALHNIVQKEVFLMVGESRPEIGKFYRLLAGRILAKREETKTKESFLKKVADSILGKG